MGQLPLHPEQPLLSHIDLSAEDRVCCLRRGALSGGSPPGPPEGLPLGLLPRARPLPPLPGPRGNGSGQSPDGVACRWRLVAIWCPGLVPPSPNPSQSPPTDPRQEHQRGLTWETIFDDLIRKETILGFQVRALQGFPNSSVAPSNPTMRQGHAERWLAQKGLLP